jgi:predicted nucleic acid-binding protein
MSAEAFVDTNVLLYAASDDDGEAAKRERAAWRSSPC